MKTLLILLLSLTSAFASNKQFTVAVYNELIDDDVDDIANLVISPFSLEAVLALAQSGAVGATGEEIRSAAFLPETQEETEETIKSILSTLHSEEYKLHTANKIFVEEGYAIKEDFKKVASDVYQADVASVDFAVNVDAAAQINKWVEEETKDKIHDLVSAEDLNENTRLVLVNAVYFESTWLKPFDTDQTIKATFFTDVDKEVETDMMTQYSTENNFFASAELGVKILELPFVGENASMIFVLSYYGRDGLAQIDKLKEKLFVTPEYIKTTVKVVIPKFKIETSADFSEHLQTYLGMYKAFDPQQADFSGIAGEKGDLFIGKVQHTTFIDVNESGVGAAGATAPGATAVEITTFSADIEEFVCDRPFFFFIKVKDVILFEGQILEPGKLNTK